MPDINDLNAGRVAPETTETQTPVMDTTSVTEMGAENKKNANVLADRMRAANGGRDEIIPGTEEESSAPGFWQSTWWNVQDDGLTANAARMIQDIAADDPTQESMAQLEQSMPTLMERLPEGSSGLYDEVLATGSVENATRFIERYNRVKRHVKEQDKMNPMTALASGVSGFIADPSNLFIAAKGAQAATKVVPKLVPYMNKTVAAMATFGATGALEESIRNIPRVMNDPTFNQEEYITAVAFGAAFGSGMMAIKPGFNAIAGPTGKQFKKVSNAIGDALHKYEADIASRTVLNTVTDLARHGKDAVKGLDVKSLDVKAMAREANLRAQEQVSLKFRELKVTDLGERIRKAADEGGDPKVVIKEVGQSVEEVVEAMRSRISEAELPDFEASVKDLMDKIKSTKLPGADDSAGSAKRQTTIGDKAEDVAHDIQQSFKDLEDLAKSVDTVLGTKGTEKFDKARGALAGIVETGKASLEAAAERQGVKIKRKAIDHTEVSKRGAQRLTEAVSGKSENLISALKAVGHEGATPVNNALGGAMKALGIPSAGNKITSISKWIDEGKTPVERVARTSKVQKRLKQELYNEKLELDVTTDATGKQKEWLGDSLDEMIDEIDSALDWMGMVHATPFEDVAKMSPKWGTLSSEFEKGLGADRQAIKDQYNSPAQRAISNTLGKLTESLSSKLVRSDVPLAEWFAMNILELPTGTGGIVTRADSAALLSRQWEDQAAYKINGAWVKMMEFEASERGYGYVQKDILKQMVPNSHPIATEVARKVQLEMNARQMGKESGQPQHIKEFANALNEYNSNMYDLQREHGVDGITGKNKMNNYMRQDWQDGKFLDLMSDSAIGEDGLRELFSAAIRKRTPEMTKRQSDEFAAAIIETKKNVLASPRKESYRIGQDAIEDAPDKLSDILETLNKRLQKSEDSERMLDEIKDILGALDNGGPGYVNSRQIHVDLSTTINYNGRELSMLELMDNDVIGNALHYGREATGRAAIAKASGGAIRSDADMDSFLRAAALQAMDTGTYVNTADMRNVYRSMIGQRLEGALPTDARKIRDAVALAGMNGLGESQLAELGLSLSRGMSALIASGQYINKTKGNINKKFRGFELTESQMQDKRLLDDMQEMTGLYEDMHLITRNDVHFDTREANAQVGPMSKIVHTATGGKYQPYLKYLQSRHTGYGAIRTMEEQIAMAGVTQDLLKHLTGRKSFTSEARFKDIGLLDSKGNSVIQKYIDDGTIIMNGDKVANLNVNQWSRQDRQSFGVALRRHAGQQVQMGYAGEMSPAMLRPDVAFLMQFKSYPLLAAEKQQGRNIKFADKEAAWGMTLNAASSAMARMVRYASLAQALPEEDREAYFNRKMNNIASDSFMYMGSAGALFPLGQIVGSAGIDNPFHDSRDDFSSMLPVANWAENYVEAAKSGGNIATGQGTDRDMYNIAAGAPLGTVLYMNMIMGTIRNLMSEDAE